VCDAIDTHVSVVLKGLSLRVPMSAITGMPGLRSCMLFYFLLRKENELGGIIKL
jgi:hypothetical protein